MAPMTCSDTQLQDEIRRRLAECARTPDPHEATLEHLDTRNVDICVEGGKVILTGTVAERRMKHRIEELVDACPGVQDIDNQIRVQV
jgi:osmotically-inducible protein OsmY